MPLWTKVVLQVLFFVIIFVVVYNQLKIHVLSKFHPNKWIILAIAILAFFVPNIIASYYKYNLSESVWQYLQSAVFIVFFLWFIDLRTGAMYNKGRNGNSRGKNTVIKPKAKPNRVNKNKTNNEK
ncbi:hypothetical protein Ccar_23085 [Clostridium carboxidivorans P7]|uniref:Uncharacterized protein n=1 Tax=Clostridium carboxidivorans P7 TaxID=536227 RepID=C6PNH5_9CLOT|nr:hypothetical protein [Clostridium carboxidivorans]AKN33545.1 hypothetical protein Ccar_23085 [Clostridium carboxidivorans P7]EET89296.1 conserved hypothetical protein [Clostridium carboxidivorans P7]EFG86873.1 hypothetical protein CLCAR_3830 [Clostridium carboxidivorans P7]